VSNTLLATINELRRVVRGPHAGRVFRAAQERHAALGPHADLPTALRALEGAPSYGDKELIVRALLAEHQAGGAAVWSSALAVAFYPMLVRLRARLREGVCDGGDLDQLVLGSFLEALREVSPGPETDRVPMRLAIQTRHRVAAALEAEQRELRGRQRLLERPEETPEPAVQPASEAPDVDGDEPEDEGAAFLAWASKNLPGDRLELLVSLHIEHVKLPSVVARRHPEASPEERRAIQLRLKRQRSRAVERLRSLVPRAQAPVEEPPVAWWWQRYVAAAGA